MYAAGLTLFLPLDSPRPAPDIHTRQAWAVGLVALPRGGDRTKALGGIGDRRFINTHTSYATCTSRHRSSRRWTATPPGLSRGDTTEHNTQSGVCAVRCAPWPASSQVETQIHTHARVRVPSPSRTSRHGRDRSVPVPKAAPSAHAPEQSQERVPGVPLASLRTQRSTLISL